MGKIVCYVQNHIKDSTYSVEFKGKELGVNIDFDSDPFIINLLNVTCYFNELERQVIKVEITTANPLTGILIEVVNNEAAFLLVTTQ
jgi:hypothetical protein